MDREGVTLCNIFVGVALCGHPSLKFTTEKSINGKKVAGKPRAGIVIALKRNGAYADDIQVQQLGYGSCLKVERHRSTHMLI